MRKSLAVLLVSLMVSPSAALAAKPAASSSKEAERAYEAARHSYYALKDDANRRRFRHNWLNVTARFDQVAKKFPKSDKAPAALFTSAELLSEMSRISMLDDDLRAAIDRYQTVVDKYPKSSLSDDAALALAKIYIDRTGDTDKARRVLDTAKDKLPRGDMWSKLQAVDKTLPSTPSARATGKRIAARAPEEPKAQPSTPVAQVTAPSPRAEEPREEEPAPSAPPLLEAISKVAVASPAAQRREQEVEAAAPPKVAEAAPAPAPVKTPEPAAPKVDPKEAQARLKVAVKAGGDEVTLAEQLGLKVRRVVIDAGHGGHDTGAIGKNGTKEKDVTLTVARRLGEILADRGLEVILTRDDDTFVRLEDRTRIANEAKGDLFISVHCNAAESRKVRGIETFTLNVASDRYSIRLAARENSASEKSISDLQFILADLATKANTEESTRLAKRVQGALVSSLSKDYRHVQDLGTKQALFYVLLGAKMPAILVETSFISNPTEEERLSSKEYQEALARSIADGVQGFLDDRLKFAQVN